MRISKKAFNLLRRQSLDGAVTRSKFDYSSAVKDGLGSATIVAPALWVSRQFPEAPIAVRDPDGELHFDHPLATLLNAPNEWYGGGTLRMALAADYVIAGNTYLETERGAGGRPVKLYYHPSINITPKGSDAELVTYYEQTTAKGPRRIEREDVTQFRNGIDPHNPRVGIAPLQSLLREVFTDDEAANMTAAVLRNMGVPGIVISPSDEDELIGSEAQGRLKSYFRRVFRGDHAGEALVLSGKVKIDTLDIDFAKMNIDKLRQIPEERVCAVIGIPAAVVGFGTGMEQTKVGATMKELRELAYENVIIPMQRVFADELDRTLLPEFEPNPEGWAVVFDNSGVRVLQEDETRHSDRVTKQWQGGLITRAEGRAQLGLESATSDNVYRQGFSDIMVPAGSTAPKSTSPEYKALKNAAYDQRKALDAALLREYERLTGIWTGELEKQFTALGRELARAWTEEAPRLTGRDSETKDVYTDADRRIIDQVLLASDMPKADYAAHYLRVLRSTNDTINSAMSLGVMLDDPIERTIIELGGTRRGLVDFDEQTRDAMYAAVRGAREEGLGAQAMADRIEGMISAGPWPTAEVRAEVIARTETKWAQNASSMEVYQRADNVTRIQVFDAQGNNPCDECIAMNGRIFTVVEAQSIEPLAHPNCSRSFAPIVDAPTGATDG